jgi:hypothetical protein
VLVIRHNHQLQWELWHFSFIKRPVITFSSQPKIIRFRIIDQWELRLITLLWVVGSIMKQRSEVIVFNSWHYKWSTYMLRISLWSIKLAYEWIITTINYKRREANCIDESLNRFICFLIPWKNWSMWKVIKYLIWFDLIWFPMFVEEYDLHELSVRKLNWKVRLYWSST